MPNDHLSPDALASIAAGDSPDPPHVPGCDSCRAELGVMRDLVAELRTLPEPPAALVDAAKAYFRRRRSLDALIERLIEDPALRAKAASKPESVLREAGFDPSPELVEALRDPGRDSGELARRLAAKSLWI
jgi:hypothetical protein